MNKEYLGIVLMIFGMFLFGSLIFFTFLVTETIPQEGLCVDGDGDVNLEGMMCDKSITLTLGYEWDDVPISYIIGFAIIALVSISSIFIGLNLLMNSLMEWEPF